MKELHYLNLVKEQIVTKASSKNLKSTDDISLDWGELKFILNHASAITPLLEMLKETINTCSVEKRAQMLNNLHALGYKVQGLVYDSEKIENCYICFNETTVTRNEQFVILDNTDEIKVKCLNCLLSQQSDNRNEREQLVAYRWFVKEKGLEESFEYFYEEQRKSPQ